MISISQGHCPMLIRRSERERDNDTGFVYTHKSSIARDRLPIDMRLRGSPSFISSCDVLR